MNFPIDKTDEWESRRDSNSMAQPSPLRYVPSITTNSTVTPQMSETKIPDDLTGLLSIAKRFIGGNYPIIVMLIESLQAAEAEFAKMREACEQCDKRNEELARHLEDVKAENDAENWRLTADAQRLYGAVKRTVNVIENLYPDQFCGGALSEHENEMKAVLNVLVEARAAIAAHEEK